MNLKQVLLTVAVVSSGLSIAGCQTSDLTTTRTGSSIFTISAKSGHKTGLLSNYMVNPDCSSGKVPDFKVAAGPANGTVDLWRGSVSPSFAQGHTLQKCNARKIAAVGAFYTSRTGFVGTDKVVVSNKAPGSDFYSYVTVHITVTK
ncbi:hypothetical protein [Phyllobacterium zundukense]|uniref:hypothetical protein n=1 Tax=Phyllobacterium zundukense TaxID=1867719 RepID=UPI0010545C7A|nr:hypothetical protein [Phyllobacterium zundukense]